MNHDPPAFAGSTGPTLGHHMGMHTISTSIDTVMLAGRLVADVGPGARR